MRKHFRTLWDLVKKYKQGFIFTLWLIASCFMTSKKKPEVHIHNTYYMCDSVLMANITRKLND